MHPKIILPSLLILFFFSCSNNSKKGEIELNNGEKWKINAEMIPPLEASEKLISDFAAGDKEDYRSLVVQLKENNQLLISSCTMKGKSHDELHKWLHPYMVLLDELENVETEKESIELFEKIEQSFETFNQYFQ
ncbi:MAG: hypothetical protein H6556_14045 [Lewinellaceae bacterium]|nr:hypothetical protein [Lewinellaceae bacterium]